LAHFRPAPIATPPLLLGLLRRPALCGSDFWGRETAFAARFSSGYGQSDESAIDITKLTAEELADWHPKLSTYPLPRLSIQCVSPLACR